MNALSGFRALLILGLFAAQAHAQTSGIFEEPCNITDAKTRQLLDAEVYLANTADGTFSLNKDGTYRIQTTPFTSLGGVPVDPTSPFYGEQFGAYGRSGTLVAPDRILTAPHWSEFDISIFAVVFGLHSQLVNGVCVPADFTHIPPQNVYFPKAGGVTQNTYVSLPSPQIFANDFFVFQLDRPVTNRVPVRIRNYGTPQIGDHLVATSHPNRFATKVGTNATYAGLSTTPPSNAVIAQNWGALGGSSGGALFNVDKNVIETVTAWTSGCAYFTQSGGFVRIVMDCGISPYTSYGTNSLISGAGIYLTGWYYEGSIQGVRVHHTATLLPSGKVLVAGGMNNFTNTQNATASVFDPDTSVWTAQGSMFTARSQHTSTLLPNGDVLVSGGNGDPYGAEIFHPGTGTWTVAANMAYARAGHTATLLPSGKVFVFGGTSALAPAEIYDPDLDVWSTTSMPSRSPHFHTATLLSSNKILIVGGRNAWPYSNTETYDPSTDVWTSSASMSTARYGHTATRLDSGLVVVAGGYGYSGNTASTEVYNPATNSWSTAGNLAEARSFFSANLLPSGKVLAIGGGGGSSSAAISGVEIFDPGSMTWTSTISLNAARASHTSVMLPTGDVVVVAGVGDGYGPIDTTERYTRGAPSFTISPSASSGGTILPSVPIPVSPGGSAAFLVTPQSGYSAAVSGTCVGNLVGTTYTVSNVTADCTVSAGFSP